MGGGGGNERIAGARGLFLFLVEDPEGEILGERKGIPEEPGGALGRGEGAGETSAISGGDGRGGVAVGDPLTGERGVE